MVIGEYYSKNYAEWKITCLTNLLADLKCLGAFYSVHHSVGCISTVLMCVVGTLRASFILRSVECIDFILKGGGGR